MKTTRLHVLPQFLIVLMLALLMPPVQAATDTAAIFKDKSYSLDLSELQALDPSPLEISDLSSDKSMAAQVVQIVSKGRIVPFTYEVITLPPPVNGDSMETVKTIKSMLDKHEDIILSKLDNNSMLGNFLHYFHRVSVKGKPHHVSSNYIFVNRNTTYHISATSYGPLVFQAESGWGPPRPDENADSEAQLLLKAMRFK